MADQISTEYDLLIDTLYIDGDTRRITLKNPKDEISEQQITTLETMILNGGTSTLLIGDRTGSPFRRINKVTRRTTTTAKLDLTTT